MSDRDIQIIIQAIDKTGSAIASIDKNLSWLGGSLTRVAVQFSTMSTSISAAWAGMQKALGWLETAAKSQQAEESFRQVAATAGESADSILEALKKASAGTIEESDIMQKAVKGITQGLKGDELVRLMEAARVAARTTGEDIGTVFDRIVDAVANKTPRALKEMGMVSKEQMNIFEQATRLGVEEVTLLDIVVANATVRQAQFGIVTDNAAESVQRFKAQLKSMSEALMGTLLTALSAAERIVNGIGVGFAYAAVGLMKLLQGMATLSAWNEGRLGNKGAEAEWRKKAEEYRVDAEAYKLLAADFAKEAKGGKNTKGYAYEDDFATRHKEKFLEAAKNSVKEIEDKWRALLESAKEAKKPKQKREEQFEDVGAMTKYYAEIEQKSEEFEKKMTEARSTELQKRYNEVDEWEKKQAQSTASLYSVGILDFSKFEADKIEIAAIAAKKRRKIAAENARAVREAEIQKQLSEIDILEKSHGISESGAIEQKITLNQELLAVQEEYQTSLDKTKDPSSWYAQADAIAQTRDKLIGLKESAKEYGTAWDGIIEGIRKYVQEQKKTFKAGEEMARQVTSGMESAFTSFFDTTSEKFMNFGELAKNILQSIYMAIVQNLIVKQLVSGIMGGLVGSANGNVFENGRVAAYANGGVFYRPTLFPMANGMGLLGEAGPEAVMPLRRTSGGQLGVIAQGGGGAPNVIINFENKSSTPLNAEKGAMKFDGKQYVQSIILSDLAGYGPIRSAFQGLK